MLPLLAPEPVAVGGCVNGVHWHHKSPVPMPTNFCVEANHKEPVSIIIFAESSVWERTQTMQWTKKTRDI
jgi:hypothetical protein